MNYCRSIAALRCSRPGGTGIISKFSCRVPKSILIIFNLSIDHNKEQSSSPAMSQSAPSEESHYRLSKKVAQLTKVIAHLNSVNEHLTACSQQIIEKAINDVKDRECGRLICLEEEITRLRDLITSFKVKEKEAIEQLASMKCQAMAKEEVLQRDYEKERISHAETVRRMSQTFEEESRRYQDYILSVRNELADGHKQRMEKLREELNSSHSEEIQLLKSRYEKTLLRVEHEASEQTNLAVENAVAKTRLEYESKLAHQLTSYTEICEGMRTEANIREEELKLQATEIPSLKEKLTERITNESKLQLDVISLQKSLYTASSKHQTVVAELQSNIVELFDEVQTTKRSLQNRFDQNKSLEIDVSLFTIACTLVAAIR
jgi:hypothetical protein